MAGFEFAVPTLRAERAYARLLLRYVQALAKHRRCTRPTEVRYRWQDALRSTPYRHYQVLVDGDLAEIQAFCAELGVALYHYSQGVVAVTPKLRRSLLPLVIPAAFLKALLEMSEEMADMTKQVAALGAPLVLNSYIFSRTGNEAVDRQLGAFSQTLVHGRNGRLAAGVLAEQAHTASELVLKRVLNARNRGVTFAKLVSTAEENALITSAESTSLLKLKDMRRDRKHRGQPLSERRLMSVLPATIGVLHRLTAALKSA